MSKSFADIATLVAPSNNTLFDRFVNITLSSEEDATAGTPNNTLKIITPPFGQKPNITVAASMGAQDIVHSINVTIYNIDANIDFNVFKYADIELGYLKSGFSTRFKGEIINIYMAKPNPNGELVFTLASANIALTTATSNFKINFTEEKYKFDKFIRTITAQIGALTDAVTRVDFSEVPEVWKTQEFTVNKSTYQFNSVMSVITWLNSLFLSVAEHAITDLSTDNMKTVHAGGQLITASSKGLPPIFAHIENNTIIIKGSYSKSKTPTLKALSNIGSAYISGDSAGTVTAPFNPDIYIGDYVFINPAYFKTRIVARAGFSVGKISSVWCVITMQFTFSTYTANTMTITVNNVQDAIFFEE